MVFSEKERQPEMQDLISKPALSPAELHEARQLAAVCNAHENLELKLGLDAPAPDAEITKFLYYHNGQLTGFCSADYGEICGMVRPDYRRKGIGSALFEAAVAECKRQPHDEILVLCERASRSGQSFIATTGVVYSFAEHHMELQATSEWDMSPRQGNSLQIAQATREDLDTLVKLTMASFRGSEEVTKQRIQHDMEHPLDQFYIARLDGAPISMLKIMGTSAKAGIYAFSVLPEYRGHGYGKQTLNSIIQTFISKGRTRFALEVETTNHNAISLYKSCGFQITTTYEYFKVR
jgi:ribosomal protein S18 acetylase RimI-like enzyme